ncbi:MAG: phage baseplate assembly protein V [Allosphingosinicella sp.]|uniref:phage baseplate assembly protein V n=1 Tax=Allosphingosinicella sp. TaxID=2823234 RepID=UPI00395AB0F2
MSDPADIQRLIGDMQRLGTVESVDHARRTCRLRIGDLVTGDVPFGPARAGRTSVWSPPSVGEQRLVFSPEGDSARALLGPAFYSDANPAPADGEDQDLVRFGDGGTLSYDAAAGALAIELPAGATVRIVAPGGVTIEATDGGFDLKGDVRIDGDVQVTGKGDFDGDVVGAGISLETHVHAGVTAGAAKTGAPE